MNDDTRLIQAALAGDPAAFGQLVRAHQDRLFNMLVHVTGNLDEAEDVAQEAFIQAYTKLSSFQGRSGFYTWIYRIAHNLWISRRRRQRPAASVDEVREQTGREPEGTIETPLQQLERRERVALIRIALDQLSDDYRAIIVLRELDGCDYDTIAEVLTLPVGTVRSRLHRARLELKRQLEMVLKEQA